MCIVWDQIVPSATPPCNYTPRLTITSRLAVGLNYRKKSPLTEACNKKLVDLEIIRLSSARRLEVKSKNYQTTEKGPRT